MMILPEVETEISTDPTDIAWQGLGGSMPSGREELADHDGPAVPDGCF
jgi:hypothetical protein